MLTKKLLYLGDYRWTQTWGIYFTHYTPFKVRCREVENSKGFLLHNLQWCYSLCQLSRSYSYLFFRIMMELLLFLCLPISTLLLCLMMVTALLLCWLVGTAVLLQIYRTYPWQNDANRYHVHIERKQCIDS